MEDELLMDGWECDDCDYEPDDIRDVIYDH